MGKEQLKFLVTGSVAEDSIFVIPGKFSDYFGADRSHKISLSMLSKERHVHRGGTGANIAYSFALLGEKPILLSSVGKADRVYIERLASLGVDTRYVHFSDKNTASFTVFTDIENNQLGAFDGGAMYDSSSLRIVGVRGEKVFVIVAPHDPNQMYHQLQECHQHGLRMCFDIGQQVNNTDVKLLRLGVQATQVLILNDSEIEVLAQKLGISVPVLKSSVPVCITTKGKNGSLIEGASVSRSIFVPVAPAEQIKDPTGAGDAYRAGFFTGYKRHLGLDICGKMGSVAAAYAIEQFGGQNHFYTKQQFLARYNQTFPNDHLSF